MPVFTDSQVVVGALGKGRASSHQLLRLCRMAAAVQLACGIRLYLRWVPSESNVADGPSRGGAKGAAADTAQGHVTRGLPRSLRAAFRRLRGQGGEPDAIHW